MLYHMKYLLNIISEINFNLKIFKTSIPHYITFIKVEDTSAEHHTDSEVTKHNRATVESSHGI